MTTQYLAMITVLTPPDSGLRPDNTLPVPQPPLGIWGPPQMGLHPDNSLPQPPPGIWGGPGSLPRPPGVPTHPIYNPPYPSQGPGFPTNPIVLPPPPGSGAPPIAAQLPVFPPEATHPIVLPPEVAPPTTGDGRPIEWMAAWSPATGWVVVGVPQGPHPTPSKK
jgi:hypothetical protein